MPRGVAAIDIFCQAHAVIKDGHTAWRQCKHHPRIVARSSSTVFRDHGVERSQYVRRIHQSYCFVGVQGYREEVWQYAHTHYNIQHTTYNIQHTMYGYHDDRDPLDLMERGITVCFLPMPNATGSGLQGAFARIVAYLTRMRSTPLFEDGIPDKNQDLRIAHRSEGPKQRR